MKDINEMTLDELDELESIIQKRKESLFNVKQGDYFIEKGLDCVFLYKITSCSRNSCSADQIALYTDEYVGNTTEIFSIEMDYSDFVELTKINKEVYEKVYILVSKYDDEVEKFKNEYLNKIKNFIK